MAACLPVATPARSPESATLVPGTPQQAARELTRLFAARGFPLSDQQSTATGLELVFSGYEAALSTRTWARGSRFYVRLDPAGTDRSALRVVGRPTLNGDDVCTGDRVGQPCRSMFAISDPERATIHGVLSELALAAR